MAKNPFRYDGASDQKPNRNVFDLSFQNNSTFKFGQITPVMCKEVLAGDSLQMKPTFAINFMPMTFPIQTRMRAYLHFYYVRHRNVWKDWEDFFGNTKQGLEMPYLSPASESAWYDVFGTGKLGDYLGLPTTITGDYGRVEFMSLQENKSGYSFAYLQAFDADVVDGVNIFDHMNTETAFTKAYAGVITNLIHATGNLTRLSYNIGLQNVDITTWRFKICDKDGVILQTIKPTTRNQDTGEMIADSLEVDMSTVGYIAVVPLMTTKQFFINHPSGQIIGNISTGVVGVDTITPENSPYYSSITPSKPIKVSALPFRGYEMIYNTFYRNSQNNPYMLNGVAEYNKYIPTDEGGADNNRYRLRFRNWEDDFLTTAVQSPQQGVAPLVGLTNRDATVTLASEDGTTTRYTLTTNEDGSVNGVEASDSGNPQLTMALVDAVSYGISIEDFRNVNALQRWLEINIRKGYKYSEVLEAHFGVNIRYNALDMPEFIGGTSQDIFVNRISQTNNQTDSDGLPLGWQSGQASCVGSGETITHYFDEPGYVFAMLTIVPVPNYSQLLPKHFLKKELLDFYFPEFGHIGFQPISYKEVCPIQANGESTATLDQTFGYQRPWYDYLASTDEVHGDFRTTLRNFVLNRTFDVKPELSESFLLVDPNQLNDVFNYQEDTDKILGQVYFDIKAKRPIPLYGIPKLE